MHADEARHVQINDVTSLGDTLVAGMALPRQPTEMSGVCHEKARNTEFAQVVDRMLNSFGLAAVPRSSLEKRLLGSCLRN